MMKLLEPESGKARDIKLETDSVQVIQPEEYCRKCQEKNESTKH